MAQVWQPAFTTAAGSVAALLDTPGEQRKPLYISGARSAAPNKLLPVQIGLAAQWDRGCLLAAWRAQHERSRPVDGSGSRLGLRLGQVGYDGGPGSALGRVRPLESRVECEIPI